MGDKSPIQWTDATWNPTTGCDRVSPGCANCYAATQAPRLKAMAIARGVTDPDAPYMRDGDPKTSAPGFGLLMHPSRLDQPLRWKRPRRIFVNSMSDLFHPEVTEDFLDQVFAVMALAPQHTFQVLTKRPVRMHAYLAPLNDRAMRDHVPFPTAMRVAERIPEIMERYGLQRSADTEEIAWPLANVWLGTSVENGRWRTRIDELRMTAAAVRFLSCEPLLGPLTNLYTRTHRPMFKQSPQTFLDLTGIDWVIVGGESGRGARPMDEQWVRDIVATCRAQGAAPFVKQMGEVWSREHLGHGGHAGNPDEWPEDLRVREMPAERAAPVIREGRAWEFMR